MSTRTYSRGAKATIVAAELKPLIAAATAKQIDSVDADGDGVYVTGPTLAPSDDTAINNTIASYNNDPAFGVQFANPLIVPFIDASGITWTNMPVALQEFRNDSGSRTKAGLYVATLARLVAAVKVAGAVNAVLIAQFSLDQAAWVNGPQVNIGSIGLKVSTPALQVPESYKTDVFVRLAGQNGDGAIDPQFGLISLQVI